MSISLRLAYFGRVAQPSPVFLPLSTNEGALPFRGFAFCERVGPTIAADLHRSFFSETVITITAPLPQLGRLHQTALHRIPVDVP